MKYKIIMLSVFIISLIIFGSVKADNSLYGKCIYLDPGHGGVDPGAYYGGIKEEDINLAIALKLKGELENVGATVYLTRDGDYDLSNNALDRKKNDLYKRVKLINNSGCDMYLSLHLNATKSTSWHGAQVFYDDINDNNVKLAAILQKQLKADLRTNRKYKEVTNGYIYRRVTIPGVLVEMGFLSNSYEREKLKTENYQYLIARSLAKGIKNYFEKY